VREEGKMRSANEWLDEFGEKEPVVILDFDGTLAEIVERPGDARPMRGVPRLLEGLTRRVKVGVLSGRSLRDLESRLGVKGVFLGGSHGLEMMRPDGEMEVASGVEGVEFALGRVVPALREMESEVEGLEIEEKPFSVAIHYRRNPAVGRQVEEFLAELDEETLRVVEGKMVRELRPALDWDKGDALRWMLKEMSAPKGSVPMYIGDDRTDEDAFEALPEWGVPILVAEKERETEAKWRLSGPGEVRSFLQELLRRV
jgi:alpha,alpha-trehalase